MLLGLLAGALCAAFAIAAIVLAERSDTARQLGRLAGNALWIVIPTVAIGTHMRRSTRPRLGTGLVVAGMLAALTPGVIALVGPRAPQPSTPPMAPPTAPLTISGEGESRRARHPTLGFSFYLPPGTERDPEVKARITAAVKSEDVVVFAYTGESHAVVVTLSESVSNDDAAQMMVAGFLEELPQAAFESLQRTGSGASEDLRFTLAAAEGNVAHCRLLFVSKEAHHHMLSMQALGADADRVLDSIER